MRIAQALAIGDRDGPVLIAVFQQQLDGRSVQLRRRDGAAQRLVAERDAVYGDDLRADGHALIERRTVPLHGVTLPFSPKPKPSEYMKSALRAYASASR